MDIVIIGSGNVATILGKMFKNAGHHIVQVFSRNASRASKLAYELDTDSTNYISLIHKNADIYILAIADDALKEVTEELKLPGKIVAHTAAAVPKEILKNVSEHYGVYYPLQSLRKEMDRIPEIPVFFDGNDEITRNKLSQLANSVTGAKTREAGNDERLKLHLAAVFVNNFVNHLYVLAQDYCLKEGIDFKLLLPLIEETANRIKDISPEDSQTGPAIRHDRNTINRHLELLKNFPQLRNIYLLMTESIQQTN